MDAVGISSSTQSELTSDLAGNQILGKDDFLELLVTQLKYQDPMNPMDNTQFASQLAEFSSLEQLQQLNENQQNELILSQSLNNSLMTNIVGKDVKAYGNGIQFNGSDVDVNFHLGLNANSVEVTIYDENGVKVRTIETDPMRSGNQKISWDGLDNYGEVVENGNYTFEVSATASDGTAVTATPLTYGEVEGIAYDQGSPYLLVNGQYVNLGEIITIMSHVEPDTSSSSGGSESQDTDAEDYTSTDSSQRATSATQKNSLIDYLTQSLKDLL